MKIRELHESGRTDHIAKALASALVAEAYHDAHVKRETEKLGTDESELYKLAKAKLADVLQKVEVEIYHLIHG